MKPGFVAGPLLGTAKAMPSTVGAELLSTSQGNYGWRFDSAAMTLSPLGLVAETASPAPVWISPMAGAGR